MKPIELFIIDDHPGYIQGISSFFNKKSDNVFIGGSAKSIDEAREKLNDSFAEIILLDLVLPGENGAEYCLELKRDHRDKKVIVLTGELDESLLNSVWLNGADAILSKTSGKKQMLKTVHSVLNNNRVIGPNIPPFFENRGKSTKGPFLTRREQQIMNLLVSGHYRKEVADLLDISIETIGKHCTNVFKKFGVDSLQKYIVLQRKPGKKHG